MSEEMCPEEMSHVQLSKHQMLQPSDSAELYWQAYGADYWMWALGLVGNDTVHWGGFKGFAKVGLALTSNQPEGDLFETVAAAAGIVGLHPGCMTGNCEDSSQFNDLLTALSRDGPMQRAFTMCFNDTSSGGGRMYLGMPADAIPSQATVFPMVPASGSSNPYYSVLSSFTGQTDNVTFSFDGKVLHTVASETWNTNSLSNSQNFLDSGTHGLEIPMSVLEEVIGHVHDRIKHHDDECKHVWGKTNLENLNAKYVVTSYIDASEAMKDCALKHMHDLVINVGPENDLVISKSSFFYEKQPCSGVYHISWTKSGGDHVLLGTAYFWGKNLLFNTTDLASPTLVDLGPADGCTKDYGQIPGNAIPLHGAPGQVLGTDGTITAEVAVGTPPQTVSVQMDTGSQKFFIVHAECRRLVNCFRVLVYDYPYISLHQGNKFHDATCQTQVELLQGALLGSSMSCTNETTDGAWLSCTCQTYQQCYRGLLEAIQEKLVPSQVCGITRKACGEPVDFFPGLSQTFEPANLPSFKFAHPPGDRNLYVKCQHSCEG
ncbi:unnamed protein product [Symbiodinium sp. CCMP2592]|nr:unnamed protein product [Symbiodinium sp. CCMP2592]